MPTRDVHEGAKKVLVLYTGGTIGMQLRGGVYIPAPNAFVNKIKSYPELYDEEFTRSFHTGQEDDDENLFAIPNIADGCSLQYRIKEYHPLLDSSNMQSKDWIRIAEDVMENYVYYDGFVILHGTDTLAYTSSALSFMLQGLQKPVVVTGAQIPIFQTRGDAKENFYNSLVYASSATFRVPEVCVFFAGKLLRGNRTVKSSSNRLEAFSSPNYPLLGEVGIHYSVKREYVSSTTASQEETFRLNTNLNSNVSVLALFPTLTVEMLESCLRSVCGAVLLSYGTGNIPSNRTGIVDVLRRACERGVVIVNVTQCAQGHVATAYETAQVLEGIGIIPGHDMTTEAALCKLAFVLGQPGVTLEEKKQMLRENLQGELTSHVH